MLLDAREADAPGRICNQDLAEQIPALVRHWHVWRELILHLRNGVVKPILLPLQDFCDWGGQEQESML